MLVAVVLSYFAARDVLQLAVDAKAAVRARQSTLFTAAVPLLDGALLHAKHAAAAWATRLSANSTEQWAPLAVHCLEVVNATIPDEGAANASLAASLSPPNFTIALSDAAAVARSSYPETAELVDVFLQMATPVLALDSSDEIVDAAFSFATAAGDTLRGGLWQLTKVPWTSLAQNGLDLLSSNAVRLLAVLQQLWSFASSLIDVSLSAVTLIGSTYWFLTWPEDALTSVTRRFVPSAPDSALVAMRSTIDNIFTIPIATAARSGSVVLLLDGVLVLMGRSFPYPYLACSLATLFSIFPFIEPALILVPCWVVPLVAVGRWRRRPRVGPRRTRAVAPRRARRHGGRQPVDL